VMMTTPLTTDLSEDVAGQRLSDTRCSFNELKQIDSRAMFFHCHHKEIVSLKLIQYLSVSPQFNIKSPSDHESKYKPGGSLITTWCGTVEK